MDFPINPPIGERVRRKETQRFITGTGRYVDDLLPPGTLHVSFARSSCAHAKIKSIDVEAARSMPGVRAVYTGKDIAQHVKPLRVGGSSVLRPVKLYPLAVDKIRYFGEPLAVVVADNRYLAEDAAEMVAVDYDLLPAVVDPEAAVEPGAPLVHVQIEDSPLIGEKLPILREAASAIGDAQVRNRGTIGGGLVEADPSGDYGAVVLALNAEMKCISPRGERVISAADLFTFAYTTALQSDEILTEVILPVPNSGSAGVYLKLERVAGDFAIASAAVQLSLDSNDACNRIGIGVTGAGTVPQQVLSVEILLRGKKITPELIDEAGRLIQEGAEPIEDLRGSAAYKKKALSAILRRAIAESLRRAEAKRSS